VNIEKLISVLPQGMKSSIPITGSGTYVTKCLAEAKTALMDGDFTTSIGINFGQDTCIPSEGLIIEVITQIPHN